MVLNCPTCGKLTGRSKDNRPFRHKNPETKEWCHPLVSDPAPTVEASDAEESSMNDTDAAKLDDAFGTDYDNSESKPGPWFTASYDGECATCDGAIYEGDTIRADGQGGYECQACEDEPVNDDAAPGFVAGPPAPAEVSHWQQQAREAAKKHLQEVFHAQPGDAAYEALSEELNAPAPVVELRIPAAPGPMPTPDAFMDPATPEETPAVNVSGQPDPRYEWWGEQNRGYLVKLPETGDFRRYKNGRPKGITRATTFNKAASDTTSLTDWKLRNVIIGASRRPDLLLQAHDLTHKDSAKLNKLAAELEAVAGAKVGADIGTFLHEFCEHIDAGLKTWRDAPEVYQAQLKLYSETLAEAGFETVPGMIERTTYIAEFGGVVGRFDRILFHRPSGMYVIADLKTGRTMDYARLENECQEWIYAHGVNEHGVYDWNTDTWEEPHTLADLNERLTVSETVGLIIHMPVQGDDAGQVILEKTDLQRGKRYAATCAENRGWVKPKRELWAGWPETAAGEPWHDIGGGLEVKHSIVLPAPEPAPRFKRDRKVTVWTGKFSVVSSREEANALYKEAKAAGLGDAALALCVDIGKETLARLANKQG